ncbi:MAG: peptide MFS transporter [Muribaculaceae bacterium]
MFSQHPKGLLPAALSNMGERFGYYIMNAVLTLFLCSKFGLSGDKASYIYSGFYCGIYILSLVGGIIADRTGNYKGTIQKGLIIMAAGYAVLSIPILATPQNSTWLLTLTCAALFMIAFGNGLFKGNLQAIVGQLYDNPKYADKRDSGFQIFYVFINVGGLIAPFVAPLLRSWWLGTKGMAYNADLPALAHQFIEKQQAMGDDAYEKFTQIMAKVAPNFTGSEMDFCSQYLDAFNTGVHYSFIASVAAMLISLAIFMIYKKGLPDPTKKVAAAAVTYTAEEKLAMAKEIKQRMYALFAVLGIAIFFWFSFHQNGASLSLFARDFVKSDAIAPEIWQAVNPFFVIILTPVIMLIFGALSRRGKAISTPRKIGIGMGIAALTYLFLMVYCYTKGYPSADDFTAGNNEALKSGWWIMFVIYFFLTVAELFISPLGLSFVSKVAPKHLQGLCQGLWLGATAVGNSILWVGSAMYQSWPIWQAWGVFLAVCLISMVVMFAMVKWLERVTA